MPADPVAAGRSRSAKKLAAARRNGFQRVYPVQDSQPTPAAEPQPVPAQEKGTVLPTFLETGKPA